MKWIKASERLPETYKYVYFKYFQYRGQLYFTGKEWKNSVSHKTYLIANDAINHNIEWLDESPAQSDAVEDKPVLLSLIKTVLKNQLAIMKVLKLEANGDIRRKEINDAISSTEGVVLVLKAFETPA